MAKKERLQESDPETTKQAEEIYLRVRGGIMKKESKDRTITNLVQKLQAIKNPE
jgi:hypothetical protein